LIAGAGALGIAGLLPAALRGGAAAQTLRLLCWPGYDEPKAIEGFRDATGADLRAEYIGANDEIFTYLRAGGVGRYDVVTPTNGVVQALAQAGLIQPIDVTRLTNVPGLFHRFQSPQWAVFDGQTYALPLSWHTAPMIPNTKEKW
jgi:spermidine/putrescine-binding protein